jgi:hypothetical protein
MRQVAATVLLISLLAVVPGWYFGYHAPASYITFWLLNTLALLNAWMLFELFFPSDRLFDACIRIAVLAFALVAMCGMLLGSLKLLTPVAYGALLLMLLSILTLLKWPARSAVRLRRARAAPRLRPVVALVLPMLVFVLCVGLAHPPVEYDSLTYHLFFPARWLQAHQISIIPTAFGAQEPAYEPANGELFFLWLMLPFHGDLLARVGQFPFYGLCTLTLYALARTFGSSPQRAIYAGGLFLLARPVVEHAVGANVDLVFSAVFLTAVYFGLTASETGKRSDVLLWGVSVGLCLGTKFLGVVYLPLLLPFVFTRRVRRHVIWVLPGIAALAAPWYLRNWVFAGSPVYPVSLAFAGLTLAPGAWERTVLNNSGWEHVTDPALLPGIVQQQAFGTDLLVAWLPFALLGTWALVRARRWVPLALALAMPAAMVALFWYVVPYNAAAAARYLFPAVALSMLLAPHAFQVHERLAPFLHAGFGAAVLWLVGMSAQPLVTGRYALLYAALAGLVVVSWRAWSRNLATFVVLFGTTCAATFLASVQSCPGAGCPLLQMSPFDRPTLFAGWAWVEQHATPATIAYAGNNIPYRLLGSHLENGVYYVNIDRHLEWRYHDYARAARRHPDYKPPETPNPPYYRQQGHPDAWIANLRRLDVDHVFVTRLSPLETDHFWHDDAGFPIEAAWAEAHPQLFTLVYENPEVKIYSVRR